MSRAVRRLISWMIYGGSRSLRDYEVSILRAVERSRPDRDREALRAQLASLDHLKRLHHDQLVTFYFVSAGSLPRIATAREEETLASFDLRTATRRLRVKVVAFRGLLSSLEFTKPPKPLDGETLQIVTRRSTGAGRDLPAEIDAAEHS